jgi:hypothetical protein
LPKDPARRTSAGADDSADTYAHIGAGLRAKAAAAFVDLLSG